LNGRLDLIQADAVIDLIRSKTSLGYHAAKEQAEGRLSERVRAIRELLLTALAEIAVRIDYPEEFEPAVHIEDAGQARVACARLRGVSELRSRTLGPKSHCARKGRASPAILGPSKVLARFRSKHHAYLAEVAPQPCHRISCEPQILGLDAGLERAAAEIGELIAGADAGRIVKDGVRAVIIGKPNVGKSSLFNALVREDAAIVTATPGTTRDAIEAWLDIGGVPVLLTDTAGIREGADDVEILGIDKAKEHYQRADVSIFLLDGSEPLSDEDRMIAGALDPEKKLIVVVNKTDLQQKFRPEEAVSILPFLYGEKDIVRLSLIDDESDNSNEKRSIALIENALEKAAFGSIYTGSSLLVTKVRHKVLLESAYAEINEASESFAEGKAPEFAEVNIRAAWNILGELIGETATDDIIDRVFEEFCVGK
jgi:small GTP-binding protein